jgi:hypothetical protein
VAILSQSDATILGTLDVSMPSFGGGPGFSYQGLGRDGSTGYDVSTTSFGASGGGGHSGGRRPGKPPG